MKPIWQTPEFWATLIGNIMGIVVLAGGLTGEQATEMQGALQAIIGGLLSIMTLFGFIKAQGTRKAAAVALMLRRMDKCPDDQVLFAESLNTLDQDAQKLLAQL